LAGVLAAGLVFGDVSDADASALAEGASVSLGFFLDEQGRLAATASESGLNGECTSPASPQGHCANGIRLEINDGSGWRTLAFQWVGNGESTEAAAVSATIPTDGEVYEVRAQLQQWILVGPNRHEITLGVSVDGRSAGGSVGTTITLDDIDRNPANIDYHRVLSDAGDGYAWYGEAVNSESHTVQSNGTDYVIDMPTY
jgi:hypothetical protein